MNTYTVQELYDLLSKESLINIKGQFLDNTSSMVTDITYNSKDVKPGALFICKGKQFKKDYLLEAIEKGALAYISETDYQLGPDVPCLIVDNIRVTMPILASIFFNHPQEKLKIIAVGGTKGKTTTASFMRNILDHYLASEGSKLAGFISSNTNYNGQEEKNAENTTPEAIELYRILAQSVDNGLEYMVMETSSQGFKYNRLDGIKFDYAIFLNIERGDHISPIEHPDFEDYFYSKMEMLDQAQHAFINSDFAYFDQVNAYAKKAVAYKTFSLEDDEADIKIEELASDDQSASFKLEDLYGQTQFDISMPGHFNVINATGAIAVANQLKIPLESIQAGLKETKVPGRMEVQVRDDGNLVVITDFAHNKASFEAFFAHVKENYPNHKVISVFGSSGGKDPARRKELSEIGAASSDLVILTSDNPNDEDPQSILDAMASFIPESQHLTIVDREEAIEEAFKHLDGPSLIAILGKGNEDTVHIKGVYHPYKTDKLIAKDLLDQYTSK